jgi:hypothetical protein
MRSASAFGELLGPSYFESFLALVRAPSNAKRENFLGRAGLLQRVPPMATWLGQALADILLMLPNLLVDVVGIILALISWRRHPRVSLLTVCALGLSITVMVVGSLVFAWLQYRFLHPPVESGYSDQKMAESSITYHYVVLATALIRNVLFALAVTLMLVAVFMDRSGKKGARGTPTDSAE